MQTTRKRDYSTILHDPESIGIQTTQYIQFRRENIGRGLKLGLRTLDEPDSKGRFLLPLIGTELMSIIARPGNGKTGFMVRWARERSKELRRLAGDDPVMNKRVVVYATIEQSVEELNAFNMAADRRLSITNVAAGKISEEEWNICLREGINRRNLPLWNIGYSSVLHAKQEIIDLDAIRGALQMIQDRGYTIDVVFIDYLQRLGYIRAESKTIGVSDNLDGLKNLALLNRCPFVVGVQAARDVDASADKIPMLNSGQWTSNIEQTSDRIISLVRPTTYFQQGEVWHGERIEGETQLLITVLKQKLGPAHFARWARYDPIYNTLDDLEKGARA